MWEMDLGVGIGWNGTGDLENAIRVNTIKNRFATALFKKDFSVASEIIDEYRMDDIDVDILSIPGIKIRKSLDSGSIAMINTYIYSEVYCKYLAISDVTSSTIPLLAFTGNREALEWLYENGFAGKFFNNCDVLMKNACISGSVDLVRWLSGILLGEINRSVNPVVGALGLNANMQRILRNITSHGVLVNHSQFFYMTPEIAEVVSELFPRDYHNTLNIGRVDMINSVKGCVPRASYVDGVWVKCSWEEYMERYEEKVKLMAFTDLSTPFLWNLQDMMESIRNGALPIIKWILYKSSINDAKMISAICQSTGVIENEENICRAVDVMLPFFSTEELVEIPIMFKMPFRGTHKITSIYRLCLEAIHNNSGFIVAHLLEKGVVRLSEYDYYLLYFIYHAENLDLFRYLYEKNRKEIMDVIGHFLMGGGLFANKITDWIKIRVDYKMEKFGKIVLT